MQEQWKVIKDFEDYEVSNLGRVRSFKKGRITILKERITHDGYVWYSLCMQGKQCTKRVNRLVAEAFIPNIDNKPTVNHKDGNKLNNDVRNLEWATKQEQMQHAYKLGLKKPIKGVDCTQSVLTAEQVKEIRSTYKARDKEFGMIALAKKYGVSQPTIDKCVRRVTYKDIE